MSYKVFIFDFDGTLADSRLNIANSVNRALQRSGLAKVLNDAIFPTIGKLSIQQAFLLFYPKLNPDSIEKLTADFRGFVIAHAKAELCFFPGVESTLHSLQDSNIYLAVLTTKSSKSIYDVLTLLGIDTYFSVIYGSGLPGGDKPSKGCVEYILDKIGHDDIKPSEVVMVGDTIVDLVTAQNAGIDSIGVTYGIDGQDVKKLDFTYTIDAFDELLQFTS